MRYTSHMNEKLSAITRTQISLIQLDYETFGKNPEEIASDLNIRPSVVRAVIEDNKWLQGGQSMSSDSLIEGELRRQHTFLPEYARMEQLLLGRARDFIDSLDVEDEDFDRKFSTMVKAIKDMRSTTSIAASQAQTASAQATAGIQLNIINQFQ